MDNNFFHSQTMMGTTGGTLLVLLVTITREELLHTALLAALGAVISFTVSYTLKWLSRRMKRRKTIINNNKNNNDGNIPTRHTREFSR